LKIRGDIIVGIDLAGRPSNLTGWGTLKGLVISACHLFSDREIIGKTLECNPPLIAIDAPLSLPKNKAFMRKADRDMHKRSFPVFPPRFRTMEKLTLRAIKLVQEMRFEGFDVIEAHPSSTRKALRMPSKAWSKIQEILLAWALRETQKQANLHHTR